MTVQMSDADIPKHAAAAEALDLVEDGMKLGLGTGSTAKWLVALLGARVRAEGLKLVCVPTSSQTREQALREGLDVRTLSEVGRLDLTIDGADEFDADLTLIKGGGGALLQEKIVATASDRMVVIADESKRVARLGAFPLPVEVVRFGWEITADLVRDFVAGCEGAAPDPALRMREGAPFVTDEGHYILDLPLGRISAPSTLGLLPARVAGVVETGLFIGIAERAIVGHGDGTAETVFKRRSA